MKNTNNVDMSLNTNKEEVKMNTFNGEIKDLVEGTVGRAFIVDQGDRYLVQPYMLEIDPTTGDVSCRKYAPYTLEKEWEGFEYVLYFEEEEEDWVEETFKDPVFGNNKEEEDLEMNEIVEALLSNYFGEKVELMSEEEENEMENQREVENMLSQYFQEEVSLINKHEELVKLHEQTWKESVREPRAKMGISTKN